MALALWLFVDVSDRTAAPAELSFTRLEEIAGGGDVETATFLERDQMVLGELVGGEPYRAEYPLEYQDELVTSLQEAGVEVNADPQKGSALVSVLINLLPFVLLVGIFLFIFHQGQGGGNRVLQFGKSKARQVTKDQPKTTFEDVAGV
ncbi:MAG: hypothetical protein ACRDIW_02840, partial [Actinomycetota bacterium]